MYQSNRLLYRYYIPISLLLTTCSTIWALRLLVPESRNYNGSFIADVSLPNDTRLYQLSHTNQPYYSYKFLCKFFHLDQYNGQLYLRKPLKCQSKSMDDIIDNPIRPIIIESRTFRIDGSDSNQLTLIPLSIRFEHFTCQESNGRISSSNNSTNIDTISFTNIVSNNDPESIFDHLPPSPSPLSADNRLITNVLLTLSDDDNGFCVYRQQFVTKLTRYLPAMLHSRCRIHFRIRNVVIDDNDGYKQSINDNRLIDFKIEHSQNDLISMYRYCLQNGRSFSVNIELLMNQCDNHFDQPSKILNNHEHLILTVYNARDYDLDEYRQRLPDINRRCLINIDSIDGGIDYDRNSIRHRRELSPANHPSNGPSFDRSLYIVSVPEEREKSFVVTQLVATPGGGQSSASAAASESDSLLYSMSALIDARSQSMFTIDPINGMITTTARLDREFMDVHYLRITVTDSHIPPRTATTTLQINVLDENDHMPVFESISYEASILESAAIGTTVITIRATDNDSGLNAEIEYSILNNAANNDPSILDVFRIDAKQGIVTTRSKLDREKVDHYTLTVQASDQGPLQSRKRSHTTLNVRVMDENDNYPQFSERSYSCQVDEDINYGIHPVILRIQAFDADEGMNAAIRYSIIGGNTASLFHIDSLNGEIAVVGPLDYEQSRSYRLIIRAQDGGSPPRSNTTQLLVTIVDKNDNEPKFYQTFYQENVLENVPIGTSVLRIQAYDSDDGDNAQLSYYIQQSMVSTGVNIDGIDHGSSGSDSGSQMPLDIDRNSGWIVTTKELDREEKSLYEFIVVAKDNGHPIQHSATASVIINVQDLNDNSPVFESKTYEAVVSETSPPGTPVVTVQASDRDENSRLIFQITGGNVRNRFTIVSQNSQGHITVANPLDYKQERSYQLTVSVMDQGGKMDLATVYINVTDANTHRPIIQILKTQGQTNIYPSTSTTVMEDIPVGSTILVVEALDDDTGENARITYSLNDINEFRIDPSTGVITTTKPLDRETQSSYSLIITAQDNGVPPLSDLVNIEIEVLDVNDNAPLFEQQQYAATVFEDVPIGTSILQVHANDRDLGLNAQIRYDIEMINNQDLFTSAAATTLNQSPSMSNLELLSSLGVFIIDPTSGVVRTNRTLDRETIAKYELKIRATDRGQPPMSTSVAAVITIDDCNDNPPRFASDRLRFFIAENSPIGSVVGEIVATDADEGANARIDYTIVGGLDMKWFALKTESSQSGYNLGGNSTGLNDPSSAPPTTTAATSKALLITRTELDFESDKKLYQIIVRASSLPLRNDVDVEIHVTDVNDHAPLLRDFSIIFNNYRGHFPLGKIIGRIPAYDSDINDRLNYQFISGNKANLLQLNESTGELRLSSSLNTNVPTRALLEIMVSDGVNDVLAKCSLSVNLVTETMLFNSVTIRLNRMGINEFLMNLYDKFLDNLSSIIPCPKDNVIIFNIQNDHEITDRQILNISFAIRLSDSLRDIESYYTAQYIQQRVYINRQSLNEMTGLEILPFDDNLCVREPCLNFEECLSVSKFGNATDFYSTEAILFRSISPVNTFACRCPIGFQGLQHKYECDIEINLCFSNPCKNDGQCVRKEGGYYCHCPENFTGKNCEIDLRKDLCRTNLCRGRSKCTLPHLSHLQPSSNVTTTAADHQEPISTPICSDCRESSEWTTRFCELRSRSFTPGSYLTFSSLKQRYRLNIRLQFATRQPNGLLLYNGRYNELHDFIALELIGGRIYFAFSLGGSSKAQVSIGNHLNDGEWHTVEMNYVNHTATIKLDNCDEALLSAIDHGYDLGSKFLCVNRTTLILESRCSDHMQTCYRFLDLTGPLQIGGLPPLPTEFQVENSDFNGCIQDLHVDHNFIDFNDYIADNGTAVGCPSKKSFCTQSSCNSPDGGECVDSWNNYVCHCHNGYTGQDCLEQTDVVRYFQGQNGFLSFQPNLQPLAYPWIVSFDIRTTAANAIVLSIQLGQSSMIRIELVNGHLAYNVDDHPMILLDDVQLNDGKWHHIEAKWIAIGITLSVDYGHYTKRQRLDGADILGLYIAKVIVGGYDTPDELSEAYLYQSKQPSLVGCIQALDVGNSKESWLRPTLEDNVLIGCPSSSSAGSSTNDDPLNNNKCNSKPCPPNSDCVAKGLDDYECHCHRGYIGKHCTSICELNPCSYGSTCVLTNSSIYGYRCQCDRHHSGFYCEDRLPETCPSDWWGSPICGPCNCDLSKGYDGNCNKTTGQCSCQMNRYQPSGSDICFECDCYMIGSYTNRCDRQTGQCSCRPGVIGRRCDQCPSPFAEVTARGCEVIYDACPRSFAEDIWWERTAYGQESRQHCPQGSQGMAKRLCHQTDGWQKPDLFACLSDPFLDLQEQWQLIVDSDQRQLNQSNQLSLINTQQSIRLINDLRVAINMTGHNSFYGSDIQLIYRLLKRLIQNELNQSGLNLTHKQDRHFLRNLCESTNAILDPRYAHEWEQIIEHEFEGPEQFLRLFNQYLEVLINNQRDTFTEPFEITTKWLIFGLDTVATGELWDISSPPSSPKVLPTTHLKGHNPSGHNLWSNESMTAPSTHRMRRHYHKSYRTNTTSAARSVYLDFSLHSDHPGGNSHNENQKSYPKHYPSVIIPKYNNFPLRKSHIDDITKAVIPLRLLNVPTLDEYRQQQQQLLQQQQATTSLRTLQQQQPTNALIGFIIFTSMATFLPSNTDSSVRQRFSNPLKANTPIVILTIKPASGATTGDNQNQSKFLAKTPPHLKILYRFRLIQRDYYRINPQCVYWSFPTTTTSGTSSSATTLGVAKKKLNQRGRWSAKGCDLRGVYPPPKRFNRNYRYDYINCSCDRTFGMAVLMDTASNNDYYYEESQLTQITVSSILSMISIITLLIIWLILSTSTTSSIQSIFISNSIMASSATTVNFSSTNTITIHKNIVFCLFLTESIYLLSIQNRIDLIQMESFCKLIAITLHYLFQCLFTWLLIDSIHLYRMLTEIRDINHGQMRFYYFMGYGLAAIIVALSVGVRADQYGNHLFCFISIYEGVIWGLVMPLCVIIIINLFVFMLSIQISIKFNKGTSNICDYYGNNLRTSLWLSIVAVPLLVLLWILALLSINDQLDELYLYYSLTTIACSSYLFVSYCLMNRRIRRNLWFKCRLLTSWSSHNDQRSSNNAIDIGGHGIGGSTDESFSATRTSVTSRNGLQQLQQQQGYYHSGSTFDVYGLNRPQQQQPNIHQNPIESSQMAAIIPDSSTTTSRSTLTKDSTGIVEPTDDGHGSMDGSNIGTTTDDRSDHGFRHGHHHKRHKHHKHHHKCRHRRHHHHHHRKSKHNRPTSEDDEVADVVDNDSSYDYSMELASSHTSDDDDDDGQGGNPPTADDHSNHQSDLLRHQQQNQINQLIHDQQRQRHHAAPNMTSEPSSDLSSSNAPTVIYGTTNINTNTNTLNRSSPSYVGLQKAPIPVLLKQTNDGQHLIVAPSGAAVAPTATTTMIQSSNLIAMTAASQAGCSNDQVIYGHHHPLPQQQPTLQQPVEHIYSYARKSNHQQSEQPSHYSTLGPPLPPMQPLQQPLPSTMQQPIMRPMDDIGLPAMPPPVSSTMAATAIGGTLYRSHYPSIRENPLPAAAATWSSNHVRLLQQQQQQQLHQQPQQHAAAAQLSPVNQGEKSDQ